MWKPYAEEMYDTAVKIAECWKAINYPNSDPADGVKGLIYFFLLNLIHSSILELIIKWTYVNLVFESHSVPPCITCTILEFHTENPKFTNDATEVPGSSKS